MTEGTGTMPDPQVQKVVVGDMVLVTQGRKSRAWQTQRTKERIKQLAELTRGEPFYGSEIKPEDLGYDKKGTLHGFFSDRVKDGTLVGIRQNHFGWKKKPRVKAAPPAQEGQPAENELATPPKNGKMTAEEIVDLVKQEADALAELAEQALWAKGSVAECA